MRFRQVLFTILALLALVWILFGISTTGQVVDNTVAESSRYGSSTAYQAGVAIGAGLGLTFFICTGLPFLVTFSLLAWRNGVGARNEQRHQEMIGAISRQSGAPAQAYVAPQRDRKYKRGEPVLPKSVNTEQQLAYARTLIQQKEYVRARAVLENTDHPTATKWLARLDDMGV